MSRASVSHTFARFSDLRWGASVASFARVAFAFASLHCSGNDPAEAGGGAGAFSTSGAGTSRPASATGSGVAATGSGVVSTGTQATSGAQSSSTGTVHVDPPTCVDPAVLPSWRSGMAIGAWKKLPSADLRNVTPDFLPGGGFYGRIDAWNGFGADTVENRLYLGGVGGHGDYAGNEVYEIDLDAAEPTWSLVTPPTPVAQIVTDSPYYLDGRPSPTHTFYTIVFVEQRAKLFRFAGAATWGSGNGMTPHIDAWDPATKAWDPEGAHPDMGPSPTFEMPTAKDVLTGDVYQVQGDNHVYRWNAATDTVDDLGNVGLGGDSASELYKSPSVVDPIARRFVLFADVLAPGTARVLDIDAGTWSHEALGGPAASDAYEEQAMVHYDACASRFVTKIADGGKVLFVDPSTLEAESFPTWGDAPPTGFIHGPHTLFQYMPRLGGYVYQPMYESTLYFLATQ